MRALGARGRGFESRLPDMKIRRKHIKTVILITLALIVSYLDSKGLINLQTTNKQSSNNKIVVSKVIDGDTVDLNTGQRVRYIGIDTPEINYGKKSECFAQEAKEFNKSLVDKKEIKIEKDISDKDKFGRVLRYVYIEDEATSSAIFVNEYLVRKGYAIVSTYPPDIKYIDDLLNAQREARENNRGLWDVCN